MVVSFFGHAQFYKKEEYENKILSFLEEKVGEGAVDIYLGGYGDFDAFAYECCRKYKATHLKTTLIFVTPYMSIKYQQNHLNFQKTKYDEIIYPEIEEKLPKFAISYRNQWMVEKSDYIVFGVDHDWGGAYKAYQYAKRKKKNIFNVTGKDF